MAQKTAKKTNDLRAVMRDFNAYCEANLKILNKEGKIVPLVPNQAQKALLERVLFLLEEGKPIRIIVLKARQMGLSTIIEALIYWWSTTHKNVKSYIVAHDEEGYKNILEMFRRYYQNSRPMWKPSQKYDTKSDLSFDNDRGTGLKSVIKTATAKTASAGRSSTVHLFHGSEVAFWREGESLMAGLMNAVPLMKNTMVFLESTANGVGGYFYKEWQAAKAGDSNFEPFFFPWHMLDEYEMDDQFVKMSDLSADERTLLEVFKEYGHPKESLGGKIAWRRVKMRDFRSDQEKFKQEYPSTDQEAFIASGRTRFNTTVLAEMEKFTREPNYFDLVLKGRTVTPLPVEKSPLKVWDRPRPGRRYVIGGDVAEGLAHGDYSVLDVMDTSSLQTVARWRGHIDPDKFGDVAYALGLWYNWATIGIEVNNHGLTTIQRLKDRLYTNLYRRDRNMDEMFDVPSAKLGWRTDMKSKPVMIDALAEAIRDEIISDFDKTFIRECMMYVVDDNGRTNAQEGQFDDTVMAKAISLQLFEWSRNDRVGLKPYVPSKNKRKAVKRAKTSLLG